MHHVLYIHQQNRTLVPKGMWWYVRYPTVLGTSLQNSKFSGTGVVRDGTRQYARPLIGSISGTRRYVTVASRPLAVLLMPQERRGRCNMAQILSAQLVSLVYMLGWLKNRMGGAVMKASRAQCGDR